MKAIVFSKYGPPDVLQLKEIEKPIPRENEVLIRIYATTVTSGDCRIRKADPFIVRFINGFTKSRKWRILGAEFSGVIESAGTKVKGFKEGNFIFGSTGLSLGAYVEYKCLPEDGILTIKPNNLTFEEAAAIPFGALASLHFLRKGNI